MTTHELKCWGSFFDAVADGRKTFEVRFNDRDYQVGDVLCLQRWEPAMEAYSYTAAGSIIEIEKAISYILYGDQFGLTKGFVVLGLACPSKT